MYLHEAQLANIVTSYCTCLGGILPLLFCRLYRSQPSRWLFAYLCILITGIPTVWLHSMEGNRVASFADVGTNILLAWAMIVAASGDFLSPASRTRLLGVITPLNLAGIGWLVWEIFAPEKRPLITFGSFGQFFAGEVFLIANAWVVVILFILGRGQIPARAKPVLWILIATFFAGMCMATAANHVITMYIFPWHAIWHITGMAGFLLLWLFNHIRFNDPSPAATCPAGAP
ncbi:MAG TPA: hypothetical protein PK379_03915 [Candidatus Hydrogenedentes bacterium]|nr:hypothetical protein [Candidatus Hydrogenedentota bacterium]HOK89150.1 hypothetical protein [Candidatus Hydrogenedentota bacterium]